MGMTGQRPVKDMAAEAVQKVEEVLHEHWDRDPTEKEKKWARRFVFDMHDRGVSPRVPTFSEVQRGLELGRSPKVMKELGIPEHGMTWQPHRPDSDD
jgi:hypothetical protein